MPSKPLGKIRITTPTRKVFDYMLRKDAPVYGLEVKQATGISGTNTLFARLEAARYVTSKMEQIDPHKEGRRPRKYYSFTAPGRRKAQQVIDELRSRGIEP
jgi:PadR family transcriptional regulator, regulatory protein PadR